jgi:hypothetical protein
MQGRVQQMLHEIQCLHGLLGFDAIFARFGNLATLSRTDTSPSSYKNLRSEVCYSCRH